MTDEPKDELTEIVSGLREAHDTVAKDKLVHDGRRNRPKRVVEIKGIQPLSEVKDHKLAPSAKDIQRAKTLTLVRKVIDPETLRKAGPALVRGRRT